MTPEEARVIDDVTRRVQEKVPGAGDEEVRTLVEQTHHQYDASRIREFVPVLVEREVLEQVRASGAAPTT